MKKITSVQIEEADRNNLNSICEANKSSRSAVLRKLVSLFLNDNAMQSRVLREVQLD